ncbi:acetyltransferase (GNAT) family protein [Paucimonas lemoignei]|uniref:Acetyltransferase (GNAT) family protein n=1 Tax=Paucimonas lemoignei TaxID=29443 RepID=A0A4R3I1L9_PAULE|nr:GNAT family N-acetyltransferase [Paucimonas lemoignei]TCS37759.1 acetyltransferase (GNAT) family protein [Paucimonas lemoignei]
MVSDEIFAKQTGHPEHTHFPIRVKELMERDRRRLLMHFLALNEEERQMRFGSALPDELVTRYVQKINFARDVLFGVYDDALNLVGVGHLAYIPRDAKPGMDTATERERIAEFGVSVLAAYCNQGIGTKLFERAAMHCRNDDIDTLYMHCLSSNDVILHIAAKAGMSIHREHGEAEAYLKLPPADTASMFREVLDEQVANLDYTLKANTRAFGKFIKSFPRVKGN